MDTNTQKYLDAYLNSLTPAQRMQYHSFSAGYYCADEYNANLCAELILKGQKTASCSMEYWYSHEHETMPVVGHLQVVTDWHGNPVCIVEIKSVELCPFNEVTAAFAYCEGEGDRSYQWWRQAHWDFFSQECDELGIKPSETMLLVLERFEVVHQASE